MNAINRFLGKRKENLEEKKSEQTSNDHTSDIIPKKTYINNLKELKNNTIVAENLEVGKHYLFIDKKGNKEYVGEYQKKREHTQRRYTIPVYVFSKKNVSQDTYGEQLLFEKTTEEEQNRLKAKEAAKSQRGEKNCYDANEINGKYLCPKCNVIERGTYRIISHNFNCDNTGKYYCQSFENEETPQLGGKRRTRRRMNKKKTKRKANKKTRMKRRKTHKKKTNKRRRKR